MLAFILIIRTIIITRTNPRTQNDSRLSEGLLTTFMLDHMLIGSCLQQGMVAGGCRSWGRQLEVAQVTGDASNNYSEQHLWLPAAAQQQGKEIGQQQRKVALVAVVELVLGVGLSQGGDTELRCQWTAIGKKRRGGRECDLLWLNLNIT